MKALLLTAGLGTRLRPITDVLAKPTVPFLNVPLMYYPIPLLEQLGAKTLICNTHLKPEQIMRLGRLIPGAEFAVKFSPEPEKPLGSGGGIAHARELLEGEGNFLVANGDEIILPHDSSSLDRIKSAHLQTKALATILVMRHPLVGTQFGGVWAEDDGRVRGFGKSGAPFGNSLSGYHYIGILLLNDRVFSFMRPGESNVFYDVLTAAIAAGELVRCEVGEFTWFESGNPGDFLSSSSQALTLLKSGLAGNHVDFLKAICRRFWPAGTRLETLGGGVRLLAPGAKIDEGVNASGFAILGMNARVETGASIHNIVLFENSLVPAGQTLRNEISF